MIITYDSVGFCVAIRYEIEIDVDDCILYAAETMTTHESGLVGTYVKTMLDTADEGSYYTLEVKGEWQKILSDYEVNPFSAMLLLPGKRQEDTFATVFSGSSSVDINTNENNLELPVYSVAGLFIGKMPRKNVLNLKPGIYIWGTQKIIVTK